jgi:opacity protein-like surface antigen
MRISIILFTFFAPALALAQFGLNPDRAQSWEMSIGAFNQSSISVGGASNDPAATVPNSSSLSLDSEWGFSFNATYNFTDHLALGMDLDWVRPRYDVTLVPDDPLEDTVEIRHRGSQFKGRFKGTYTFSENNFTPFVDVGLGWTRFDTNVADGPPVTGCWWHPWWGYICENFYSTFSSTEFTYGTGVGLRYDLSGGGVLKASYNYWWLDSGGKSDDFSLDAFRIEYGWRF